MERRCEPEAREEKVMVFWRVRREEWIVPSGPRRVAWVVGGRVEGLGRRGGEEGMEIVRWAARDRGRQLRRAERRMLASCCEEVLELGRSEVLELDIWKFGGMALSRFGMGCWRCE